MQRGRALKARCRGAALNVPGTAPGELAVRLELGPPRTSRYCMQFGGTVRTNAAGRFEAKGAPRPARCVGD